MLRIDPRMGCAHLHVVGALRQPPPGKEGDECILRLAVLPGYKPVFQPPPPHLEAIALETSEPRQQLQKLGTRSPVGWGVGRGHKGEGLFDLKPSPYRGHRAGKGAPSWGEHLG